MNKKYATVNQLNEVEAKVDSLSSKLDSIIAMLNQPKAEPQSSKKTGTSKKAKSQTSKKSGTSKAAKATKSNDFDRSLYEATAKKLGCFAYGKVVATYVDGKQVRSREENRELVYAAMGHSK